MSGISGIINLETEYKVSNQSFINSLAHRGLNSINTKRFANKSTFTFYSTFTSIESTLEVQPIVSGNIILTCDARIDNRRELKKLLNLQTNPIPDSELILGLFKKFGKSFVEKIKGDFCIVIYNKEEKKIYLMRDYIGARPLYYIFLPGNIFSFSSEIKSFWNLPQITKKVKKNKVANYLRWLSDLRPYENSTFFENIYSVFPASILEIDLNKNKVKSNYFWKPSIERFLHLKTDKEFAKEFQKLLKNSVTNRINSKYRTASHLSGGLDSSFISILAKTQLKDNHNLITVHHDGENQLCDEKYYTKKVIETGGINNFWITKTNDLNKDLNLTHKILDSPDLLSLPVSLFRIKEMSLLKKKKVRVLLTGHDGDTVAGKGYNYLLDLLKKRNLPKEAFKNKNLISWLYKTQLKNSIKTYRIGAALKLIHYLLKHKAISFKQLILMFYGKTINLTIKKPKSILKKNIKNEPFFNSIYQLDNDKQLINLTEDQKLHFKAITCAGISEICEQLNILGSYYGIEVSHPMLDKDLIELCLATPARLRYYNGLGRGQMRLAMENIVPNEIVTRKTKVEFSPILSDYIKENKNEIISFLNNKNEYIDSQKLIKKVNKIKSENTKSIKLIQRTYLLNHWLENN